MPDQSHTQQPTPTPSRWGGTGKEFAVKRTLDGHKVPVHTEDETLDVENWDPSNPYVVEE